MSTLEPIEVNEQEEIKKPKRKKSKKNKEKIYLNDASKGIGVESTPIINQVSPVVPEKHNMTPARKEALANARLARQAQLAAKHNDETQRHEMLISTLSELKDYLKNVSSLGVPQSVAPVSVPKDLDLPIPETITEKEPQKKVFAGINFKKSNNKSPVTF